ncbi:MAG: hypothetical protein LBU06_10590 [Desulfovibrio sp.]|jgi:uncharacterized protein YfaS (alpha-2-macroglobulin family)|nr:hypothetical protein [Desulfovibrio sp.]
MSTQDARNQPSSQPEKPASGWMGEMLLFLVVVVAFIAIWKFTGDLEPPATGPAARLQQDDAARQAERQKELEAAQSGEEKKPKLFLRVEHLSGQIDEGVWKVSWLLLADEDKCASYAGNAEQCRELLDKLPLRPEEWKLAPPLPAAWKTEKHNGRVRLNFSAALEDLPDPARGRKLKIALPSFGENVEINLAKGHDGLEAEFPQWDLNLDLSRVFADPENSSRLLVQAEVKSSLPLNRESLEKRLRFSFEGEGFAAGTPALRWGNDYSCAAVLEVARLPVADGSIVVTVDKGVSRLKGNGTSAAALRKGVKAPGRDAFVAVSSVELSTLIDDNATARPMVFLDFTCPVDVAAVAASIKGRLLPLYATEEDRKKDKPFDWANSPKAVTGKILADAPAVGLALQGKTDGFAQSLAFSYNAPSGHFLYIEGAGGISGSPGYVMRQGWHGVRRVPALAPELRFMQDGHILGLDGARKLALEARGLDAIKWRIWQVRTDYLNILANHSGSFTEPDIAGDHESVELDEISEATEGVINLPGSDGINPQYAFLDLGELMREGRRGIFQIRMDGLKGHRWHREVKSAKRFILLTDLGMVVKKGLRGERAVFVSSLGKGGPAAGAEVRVIARNGVALFTATSDAQGRADLPDLEGFVREKSPVAIEARLGTDMTYMPIEEDRQTRIRTGIVNKRESARNDGLSVYAFSERGIFRPGEELRFGLIAKNADWDPLAAQDLPLFARLVDPLGRERGVKTVRLGPDGIGEAVFPGFETPVGRWYLNVELAKRQLEATSVQVEDFQPDRIKVGSRFLNEGGASAEDLKIEARVENLYGGPSVNSLVRGSFRAQRVEAGFIRYQDYSFFAPAPTGSSRFEEGVLGERFTDETGTVHFTLPLRKLEQATYVLTFSAEGFEAGGGRSVLTRAVTLVSPFSRFIGTRSDANLDFLAKDAPARLEFISVDRAGNPADSEALNLKILAVDYPTVLVKSASGVYRYEVGRRTRITREEKIGIPASGFGLDLPVGETGDFELRLEDENGALRTAVKFTVAGGANRYLGLKRDATLRARLDKESYRPGEEMQVFVSAPYAGYGLITLENDSVRAHAWFRSETTDSVQKIVLPDGFEGRGYLVVHLLRDAASDAVHSNPAANVTLPFLGDMERRDMGLSVETPEKVVPGEELEITVRAEKAGKALVFAVDEGILQLTGFRTPSPLAWFMRDKPLEVTGNQNWNLLMPEYGLVQQQSAFGGDLSRDALSKLNPFRRKGEDSAVYWSGLVDVGPSPRTLSWNTPAHFNGRLRVMAIAAGEGTVGESETALSARAPVIITPTLPVAVAPGDVFDVALSLANNAEGSGKGAMVSLEVLPDAGLVFESEAAKEVAVDEGGEALVVFRLKATERLGESVLRLAAAVGEGRERRSAQRPVSLSVRPAVPRISASAAGRLDAAEKTVPVARDLYPQFSMVEAGLSGLPLPLVQGPARFLADFPHGCTEQVLSMAFPYALLHGHKELLPARADGKAAVRAVDKAVQTLRERQLRGGVFSLWPGQDANQRFLTVYGLDFLLTAKESGFSAPQDLIAACASETRSMLSDLPSDLNSARMIAYAALTHTRAVAMGVGGERFRDVSRLIRHCDERLPGWRKDVSAALFAGTYSLMRQDKEAADLIKDVVFADPQGKTPWRGDSWFISDLWANGLFMHVLAEHFPGKLQSNAGRGLLIALINAVAEGCYSTTGAVQAIRGITAYAAAQVKSAGKSSDTPFDIKAVDREHRLLSLESSGTEVKRLRGDAVIAEFVFSGGKGLYWQIGSEGFDRVLPPGAEAKKIEVKADYLLPDGRPLAELRQGDDLLVLIRAKTLNGEKMDNIAITSLLPGGFEMVVSRAGEIEEAGSGAREALKAAGLEHVQAMRTVHVERREDRMLIYASLDGTESMFAYRVKAVNRGRFTLPVTYAEALYDPEARARTGTGAVETR